MLLSARLNRRYSYIARIEDDCCNLVLVSVTKTLIPASVWAGLHGCKSIKGAEL